MSFKNLLGQTVENNIDDEMSRRHTYNYRYIKNMYPNVYKLPENEINSMLDIVYKAPDLDQVNSGLQNHIKQNQQRWETDFLNPKKPATNPSTTTNLAQPGGVQNLATNPNASAMPNQQPWKTQPLTQKKKITNPYLRFNGQELSWVEDGNVKKSWVGMSGKPEYQCPEFQNLARKGPLPEGLYHVNQDQLQHYDDASLLNKMLSSVGRGGWPGGPVSWGKHRVWLKPDKATNTLGRDKFSIHGGYFAGSSGCIDLTNQMDDFNKIYKNHNQDMNLIVEYPKNCWKPK